MPANTILSEELLKLKLVQAGDPVLRRVAEELTPSAVKSADIQKLIELMRETMRDAPGVGLAAPQVGVPLRLAVIEDKAEYLRDVPPDAIARRQRAPVPFHVIVNPIIKPHANAGIEFFEGCLSLPGFTALVPRHASVTVECLDHRGDPKQIQASGWYARILQHEIDHLHGTLYVDRMHTRSFMSVDNFNRYWKALDVLDVKRMLAL